jgi:hypothetical protein
VSCTNCSSWKCGPINPPDTGHDFPYCDMGSCNCLGGTPDWNGNWSSWIGC